ncbi:hypothetical protein GF340_05400, partial [Candidatus Peregrinibacteria bacterium]|nr:hypothetical protein [Candidatus Peregrinibacteria bacterium]
MITVCVFMPGRARLLKTLGFFTKKKGKRKMRIVYLIGVMGLVALSGCNKQKDAEAPTHEEGVQASVDWQLGKEASAESNVGRTTFDAAERTNDAPGAPGAPPASS